jgi:hypothetical protein
VTLRICLVTPFSWSQPHDVNEHVAGAAGALRDLGHEVSVLAPSNRAADLLAGRRALQDGARRDVIALGPAVPISRRSRIGLPVGVRANLALALARGEYDVVHGFEPGLPSLSYLALRDARSLAVATFLSPDRLGYPPGRAQRKRLLGRLDALLATSALAAEAAETRFPGEYRSVPLGVDTDLFSPAAKRRLVVCEWRTGERPLTRAVLSVLKELPDWELILLRTKPLSGRPSITPSLRKRVHVRTALSGALRAPLLNEAAIFVPGLAGLPRLELEAQAAGAAIASPPGVREQPALAAAAFARLAEHGGTRKVRASRTSAASWTSSTGGWRSGGARSPDQPTRCRTGRGSSATFTRTPRGPTIVSSSRPNCSTRPSGRGWERSRSPTTTRSAARSRPPSSAATAS